jgi:predicted metalloprotease with PDZ domain
MLNSRKITLSVFLMALLASSTTAANAQSALPQPAAMPPPIAVPQDIPFPGVISLQVDATDLSHHIFRVRETVPVNGGDSITLLYPEWIPGKHGPRGRVDKMAGLIIHAAGERVEWTRDPINKFAFHVAVPAGATTLDLEFQYVSPVVADQGRIVMTAEMLNLQWDAMLLYPAGHFSRQISVQASVRVPENWHVATALEVESSNNNVTEFKAVSLYNLVDSPIFAGRYFRRIDLNPDGNVPVHLNLFADRPDSLEATPEQIEVHRALVREADLLFGSHHFDHYEFLFALTDRLGGIGIEHHQSSQNTSDPTYFTDWDKHASKRGLLPHEYTHSWDGKFRQPADLWIPEYSTPIRGSLLWVYEGQTTYWGRILSARAGFQTLQQSLDSLAYTAASYDIRVGRQWRALQDTTADPVVSQRRPRPWFTWERNEGYYSEGAFIWLDADTLIREATDGEKSLDDFSKAFYGMNDGSYVPLLYTFEDVVSTLHAVHPYDWATFLRTRLDGHGPGAPLDGIERGGYELVYTDTPTDYYSASEASSEKNDLDYSIGITVGEDGVVSKVQWDSPAFKAGVTISNQIIAVDEIAFGIDGLKRAITNAKTSGEPIVLLIMDGDRYHSVELDYDGGLRYPRLVRKGDGPAYLDQILSPRSQK